VSDFLLLAAVAGPEPQQAIVWWVWAIIYVVLIAANILLAPKPELENAKPKGLGDFQFPTATEGRPLPVVFGTTRIKAPNVVWYGDFYVKKIKESVDTGYFSDSDVVVGFIYHVGLDFALCFGPVDGLTEVEVANKVVFSGSFGGTGATDGTLINVNSPEHFGGRKKGGGLFGRLRFYDGVPSQQKNAYLVGVLGPDVPGYVDVCHAVWERGVDTDLMSPTYGKPFGEIGESTNIQPWAFTVKRFPNNLSLGSNRHIVNGGDANPAEVLYEVFTNNKWGLGRHPSTMNFSSFQAAGITLYNEGNGFSMLLDREQKAEDFIAEVLRQIDGALYMNEAGQWTLKLARSDYTLGSLPLFDETNIVEVTEFTRGSWEATSNDISVEYFDRTDDFKDTFAMGQDIANFNIQGGVKSAVRFQMSGVKHPLTAKLIAERELRAMSFPHAKATIVADRTAAKLVPGDVIRFSWPPLGISEMPMRVMNVNKGEILDGRVQLNCAQDVFGVGFNIYDQPPASGWDPITDTALAFSAANQHAFDAPYWFMLTGLQGAAGERIFAVGQRPNGLHTEFRMSVDAGSGYFERGRSTAPGFTPTGLLNAAYPENTADVESSGLLVVKTTVDFEDLVARTWADIRTLGVNLVKIDDEILGFETLTRNVDGTYTLGNVHRGLLDTLPAAHAQNARVWVFSAGSARSRNAFDGTTSTNVKLLPETPTSLLDLASATAISLLLSRRTERPLPVGGAQFGGHRYPTILPDGDVAITWKHRHRQDPQIQDQSSNNSALGLDANIQYEYTFWELDTGTPGGQLRQATTTGTSFTYTRAQQTSDNGGTPPQAIRARIRSKDTALTLDNRVDVIRDFEVFNVQPESVDLNGTDEGLRSSQATIGIADVWSVMLWAKRSDSDTAERTLCAVGNPSGANSIHFVRKAGGSASDLLVEVRDSGGSLFKQLTYSGVFTGATWHHVVATFDGTASGDPLVVYVDGVARTPDGGGTDSTGTMTDTSRRIAVGCNGNLASFAQGRFHQWACWNVALSATQVTAIYNGGNGSDFNLNWNHNGYTSRTNLKQWFRIGRDSSPDGDIGKQYALNPTGSHNLSDGAQNVTATDVVTDAP
jgi:hypothetical protein